MNSQTPKPSSFHGIKPDYERLPYQMPEEYWPRIIAKLVFLYGARRAEYCFKEILRIISVYHAYKSEEMIEWEKCYDQSNRFTEKDVVLITYGDLIKDETERPLETLAWICRNYLNNVFNIIHLLPFFPYSSDRGFSVTDFKEVDPRLGNWENILGIKDDFKLMFDGVFNHVSAQSEWFQEYLNDNPEYRDFFIDFSTKRRISRDHLNILFRPRTTEVLTSFPTLRGTKYVWTTFSPDQVDLNYHNPRVLNKIIEILLFYVRRGADIIRLDAVTYLWYERGTSGVHLQQTHMIIKLLRDILNVAAPHVALVTETNVPHRENIGYFGNGHDEAQMVYNFALPPLVLHTFITGDSSKITEWAAGLTRISETATYLNFLDSHDGIGVMGAREILSSEEIDRLARSVEEHGGYISYRKKSDGSLSPYEFNITFYSALNYEGRDEDIDFQIRRYLAARSITLVLMGVPGIYFHGLIGSQNDIQAVQDTEDKRSINRKILKKQDLVAAYENPVSTTHKIAYMLGRMIMKRTREKAFHPNARQTIIDAGPHFFTLVRVSVDGEDTIICITNVTGSEQAFSFDAGAAGFRFSSWYDLLGKTTIPSDNGVISMSMGPYDVRWLKASLSPL
ncbi:MAG: sugar phosphorylase [Chrysiogenales bacterium]|nr:MAG: sugar phosphorylase [Chrysiogenales bacterium]